jgi:hypothetical protein
LALKSVRVFGVVRGFIQSAFSRAGQVLFVAAKFVSTMKSKLILCLAFVLSGGLLPVCAQNTNRCD